MDVVAVVAAITSVAGALATVVLGAQFERSRQRAQRRQYKQDLAERYSQPLLAAASSLALAIGNADPQAIQAFSRNAGEHSERLRDYALYATLYRVARYLCWVHIISAELRALDLGNEDRNRELILRLRAVRQAGCSLDGDQAFMLLGGEQWALGELMVDPASPPGDPRCIGYVAFRERIEDEAFARWFYSLVRDMELLIEQPERVQARLRRVKAALDELIELLDPKGIWVPVRAAP